MTRDTLITILLVVAGVVLAIVLFGAGALWKSKSARISWAGEIHHPQCGGNDVGQTL